MPRSSPSTRSNLSTTVAGATAVLALASCSDNPVAPAAADPEAKPRTVSAEDPTFACRTTTRAHRGGAYPFQVSVTRFRYPQSAQAASGKATTRKLVVTNADGDTLSVTSCAAPDSRRGEQLVGALFDNVGAMTTSRPVRTQRRNGITVLQLSATRARRPARSAAPFDAPVCTTNFDCAVLVPPAPFGVSLSAQSASPTPPPVWMPPGVDCEWDMYYGCDNSNPNSGGGGSTWDPDVILGLPSDSNLEYYCDSGVTNGTCLRPLSNAEYVAIVSAVARFRPDADLRLISQACVDAAYMVRYYLDHGLILAGTNGAGSNGLRHLAEYGSDMTPNSPTYGQRIIHLDYAFLAAVQNGVLNGIDYDELDLANVLLHEGMHAWTNGQTYSHGPTDAVPLTQPGFNMVNPRTATTPTSQACVQ